MTLRSYALAGTALGLLMAGAMPASAAPAGTSFLVAQGTQPEPASPEMLKKKLLQEKKGGEAQKAPAAREKRSLQPERPADQDAPKRRNLDREPPARQAPEKSQEAPAQKLQKRDAEPPKAERPSRDSSKPDSSGEERRPARTLQPDRPRPADEAAPARKKPDLKAPSTEESGQRARQPDGALPKAGRQEMDSSKDRRKPAATPESDRRRNLDEGPKPVQRPQGSGKAPAQTETNAPPRPRAPGTLPADGQDARTTAPRDAAPVLDSAKERRAGDRRQPGDRNGEARKDRQDNASGSRPAPNAGPRPRSDAAAQSFRDRVRPESADAVKGKRVEGDRPMRRERPEGAEVLKEIGNRIILNLGGQTIVQSRDNPRLRHGSRDVYYEDLPGQRTRETISREDGSRVVTIRDRYGDVIRRSRFTRDGREIVLVYVDDEDLARDRSHRWRDPGADLPPMELRVPVTDYILDAQNVRSPDRYYDFLEQPPVERVERLYSLGEVKRSARIRDKLPRVDLDTINFEFGSASVPEDQIEKLQGVADAIHRIIERNPAEMFLIEGHTDAVGSDEANLALSDQRAESVADVLTNVFEIMPENLATQGYGEEYLKVDVPGPSRENRRVAIRRITPLVSPVADAQ